MEEKMAKKSTTKIQPIIKETLLTESAVAPLKKLTVNFKDCSGINKLEYTFDFSKKDKAKAQIIYAPNGSMKSSFAKTFESYADNGIPPQCIPYKDIAPSVSITDESGKAILQDEIFVIHPMRDNYKSRNAGTLLVNERLRVEYATLQKEVEEKEILLAENLGKLIGIKNTKSKPKNLQTSIVKDFTRDKSDNSNLFMQTIEKLEKAVERSKVDFSEGIYTIFFNDKVDKLFTQADFAIKLKNYVEAFNKILASSTFFKNGFNPVEADHIAQEISDTFFQANHRLKIHTLKGKQEDYIEVNSKEDLARYIKKEEEAILKTPELQKAFKELQDDLQSNKELKIFADYLHGHPQYAQELLNREEFRESILASCLKQTGVLYTDAIKIFDANMKKIDEIKEEAKREKSTWDNALLLFKSRFKIPCNMHLTNRDLVALCYDDSNPDNVVPAVSFTAVNKHTGEEIQENNITNFLSTGEKRAMYLLNVIFEILSRKKLNRRNIFIFDDVADSFDYKNKYAIIQYLCELAYEANMHLIILTHNFDFFRTITSRLNIKHDDNQAFVPDISSEEVKLLPMSYLKNPFNTWKSKLANPTLSDVNIILACIPFIRNLQEYINGTDSQEYNELTCLLHIKPTSMAVKINDLENYAKKLFPTTKLIQILDSNKSVIDLIFDQANGINDSTLENKIVLSMAIRLQAEKYLINRLSCAGVDISSITKNQTFKLIEKYQQNFASDTDTLDTLEKVQLMTPENIHLNAFMFEPILDMGIEELKGLYQETKTNLAV
ncbi:MAG: hypothetical protein LBR69_03665 [Endomicrobium sp.]|nr:hypothetical protein [Endomicrobium sp.]